MFKNLVLQMHRELITSGGGSNSTTEEQPPVSELTPEPEPNPNPQPPAAPPTDTAYVRGLQEALERNNEIMRQMQAQLDRVSAAPVSNPTPTPAPRSAEEVNKEYYESPGTFVERRIDAALERTVKPLNDFVQNIRSTEQVDRLINDVKTNPKIATQWDSAVEDVVRKQLASVPASNLNIGLAQQAAINAIGLKVLGAIGTATPPTPAPIPNQEIPVTIPPNVRPTNPPAPNSRPPKKVVELNENERRVARENRMTPEEFVFFRDMPPDKVMTAKWDRTKNEGTY